MTRDDLAQTLVQLRRRVDAHFDAALARTPAAFQCAEGCSSCCVRFSVFTVEAAPIRQALASLAPELRARVRSQADDPTHADRCALLVDHRCSIYDQRPTICRSHGLPISEAGQIHNCSLNFTQDPPPPASVLRLEAVNQPLAVMASLWEAARSPTDVPTDSLRIDLATLAREPDPTAKSPAPAHHDASSPREKTIDAAGPRE